MGVLGRAWSCRWGAVRLGACVFILWVLVADTGARLARLELANLPDFDFAGEVARLRVAERFGEAVLVADEGLDRLSGPARATLEAERAATIAARDSWSRRTLDALKGVALGADADASLERLVGAIAADFFVIGDVRDLAIQGWRYLRDGEADGVIVALSAIGIATTLAPEIDWAPSILKAARRAGSMTRRFGEVLVGAVSSRNTRLIEAVVADTASIVRRSSPATASRLLRLVEEPADLARLARFVEREGRAGAFALRQTSKTGAGVVREAEGLRSAGRVVEAARAEEAVVAAAGKGAAGAAWLERGTYRVLLRPHPLVGVAKSLWSGHAANLIQRALERTDPGVAWALPLLAGWAAFELGLIAWRLRGAPAVRGRALRPAHA